MLRHKVYFPVIKKFSITPKFIFVNRYSDSTDLKLYSNDVAETDPGCIGLIQVLFNLKEASRST